MPPLGVVCVVGVMSIWSSPRHDAIVNSRLVRAMSRCLMGGMVCVKAAVDGML